MDNVAEGSSPARDELDALVEFIMLPPEQLARRRPLDPRDWLTQYAVDYRYGGAEHRLDAGGYRELQERISRGGGGFRGGDIPPDRDGAGGFGEWQVNGDECAVENVVGDHAAGTATDSDRLHHCGAAGCAGHGSGGAHARCAGSDAATPGIRCTISPPNRYTSTGAYRRSGGNARSHYRPNIYAFTTTPADGKLPHPGQLQRLR